MIDAFAEIKDSGGDLGWGQEGLMFVFEGALFELLAGYPAENVYLRVLKVEAKHIQKRPEEEKESELADRRQSGTKEEDLISCVVEELWCSGDLGTMSQKDHSFGRDGGGCGMR